METLGRRLALAGMLGLGAALPAVAQTQPYPNKLIRLVVGFPAGGITDVTARVVATELEALLGQRVLIDNKPGATGAVGAAIVAKAPPDGYTLYFVIASHTVIPVLNKQLQYDTLKDFAAISQITSTPNMFALRKDSPINTLDDLIAAAKKPGARITYSTPGYGTTTHLTAVLFERAAGITLTHVPYKSSVASVEAAAGGEVDFVSTSVFTGGAAVKDGRLKPLAVAGDERFVTQPDVKTFRELGYNGIIGDTWMGLIAPAGTPADVVDRLYKAVKDMLAQPAFREKLLTLGANSIGSSPAEFQKRIEVEVAAFKDLGEKVKLSVD
jgi:tripartite-type tricarboxylate transporter receptor subunit TctC